MNLLKIVNLPIVLTSFLLVSIGVLVIYSSSAELAIQQTIFTFAGYTYGPLLGLYAFGLFTKHLVNDKRVWIIAVIAPILCYILSYFSEKLFFGYKFGYELLIVNGLITYVGLWLIRRKV